MKVLNEWWKTVKDHEGMLQVLGQDPAGNVSEEYLVGDSAEQIIIPFAGLQHAFHVL